LYLANVLFYLFSPRKTFTVGKVYKTAILLPKVLGAKDNLIAFLLTTSFGRHFANYAVRYHYRQNRTKRYPQHPMVTSFI